MKFTFSYCNEFDNVRTSFNQKTIATVKFVVFPNLVYSNYSFVMKCVGKVLAASIAAQRLLRDFTQSSQSPQPIPRT